MADKAVERGKIDLGLRWGGGTVEYGVLLNVYANIPPEQELTRETFQILRQTGRVDDDEIKLLHRAQGVWADLLGKEGSQTPSGGRGSLEDAFAGSARRD